MPDEWCLGLDTETTGLYIKHGCRPFFVSAVGDRDETDRHSWEWQVDPISRIPRIPKKDVANITELINSVDKLILHNCKYDLHALQTIGVRLPPWNKIYDTMTECHVLDSSRTKKRLALKPLAAEFLDISIADQKELHRIVIRARNIASKKLGWSIAKPTHPHFQPVRNVKGSKGFPLSDMWIPKQIANLPNWKQYLSETERASWLIACEKYAMLDAERTILLHYVFFPEIEEQGLLKQFYRQQAVFCPLFCMEKRGFPIKQANLKPQSERIKKHVQQHTEKAVQIARRYFGSNVNLNSYVHLSKLFYQIWNLPVIKYGKPSTTTGQRNPSTDFETKLKLAFEDEHLSHLPKRTRTDVKEFLKESIQAGKLKTGLNYLRSYADNCIDNRVYTTIWNQGTATTRLSSTDPNLMNIGKGGAESGVEDIQIRIFLEELAENNESLRCVFGPEEGTFWYDIDYSQLQLRIFAFVAGEESLIKAFQDGWDAHTYVARRIFNLSEDETPSKLQRRIAKAVNFGFIFGASPEKIEATAGRPGLWDEVISIFPSAHRFMKSTMQQVYRYGYVTTPGGYRLTCTKPHAGVNYIVQGSEGEIAKRAMVECKRYLNSLKRQKHYNCDLILPVHDEIVFEFPLKSNKIRFYDKQDKDGKVKKVAVLKNPEHVIRLASIMAEAGAYFGIETPTDPQLVTHQWDQAYDIDTKTSFSTVA